MGNQPSLFDLRNMGCSFSVLNYKIVVFGRALNQVDLCVLFTLSFLSKCCMLMRISYEPGFVEEKTNMIINYVGQPASHCCMEKNP